MDQTMPQWFSAHQTFRSGDGWYIGSAKSLSIGPFASEFSAEIGSRTVSSRLRKARDLPEMTRVLRSFLGTEGVQKSQPQSLQIRAGEELREWPRKKRVFQLDSLWFISTREGIDVGPYESSAAADREAAQLIDLIASLKGIESRRIAIFEFMRRPTPVAVLEVAQEAERPNRFRVRLPKWTGNRS